MKEIKATIKTHMISKVISALHELPTFPGLTTFDCLGQGRGRGQGGTYITPESGLSYHEKKRIEIICPDHQVDEIVAIIAKHAHTGNPGDGIIGVSKVDKVIRIRTGQIADAAL